jgi:SAM-dependent methyltransferase
MDDKLHFAVDLYQGTAEYYDRYRLPYPEAMTEDLIARTGVSGHGRLLDLACGTGQLAFPLRRSFAEVWAVDREPGFTQMVQAKADKLHGPFERNDGFRSAHVRYGSWFGRTPRRRRRPSGRSLAGLLHCWRIGGTFLC